MLNVHSCLVAEELTPLVSRLDAEKTAKEEALAAKTATERKSRDFITGQNELIEKLNREKVTISVIFKALKATVIKLLVSQAEPI